MKILDEIITLYNEINDVYEKLLQLDMNGLVKGKEFLGLVYSLKKKIYKEEMLFNVFFNNYKREYDSLLEKLALDDCGFSSHVSRRLYDYMNTFSQNKICINYDLSFEEKMIDDIKKKIDQLHESYSLNLSLIYFSFLSEAIGLSVFAPVRNYLRCFKYYSGLVNHDLEKQLIENNFNFDKVNYIDTNVMAKRLGLFGKINDEVKYMVSLDMIRECVIKILQINNNAYNDEFMRANVINATCMLRACLIFITVDENIFKNIVAEINNIINDHKDLNHWISEDIIKSIINNVNNDMGRVRKLSLGN